MNRRVWLIVLLVGLLVASAGCAVTGLVDKVVSVINGVGGNLVSVEIPTPQRATLYPTLTAQPSPDTRRTETVAALPQGKSFRIELGETEVSEMVGEKGFSAQGLEISNVTATITPNNVFATFDASHADSGLSGEITVVGVPQVVAGKLYLEIVDFSLGSSFTGFTRLIATGMVQTVLDKYNTGNGIPVPIKDVAEVTSVELLEHRMVVMGTSR
jgi:hypothetical protein